MKELKELLAGVEVLAVFGAKVGTDGKINLKDIAHVKELAEKRVTIIEAIKGVKEVDDELKVIVEEIKSGNIENAVEIIGELVKIGKAVKEALKAE